MKKLVQRRALDPMETLPQRGVELQVEASESPRGRDVLEAWESTKLPVVRSKPVWKRRPTLWLILLACIPLADVILGVVGLSCFQRSYFDTLFVWVNGTMVGFSGNATDLSGLSGLIAPRCSEPTCFAWTVIMSCFLIGCGIFAFLYIVVVLRPQSAHFERARLTALSFFLSTSCPALITACVVVNLSSTRCNDGSELLALGIVCVVLNVFIFVAFAPAVTIVEYQLAPEPPSRTQALANVYILPETDLTSEVEAVKNVSKFGLVDEFN
jgi:hypothetical protein